MDFPYKKIFKQAGSLIGTKFLWLYGLFLSLFVLSSFYLNSQMPRYFIFVVWFLLLALSSRSKAGLIWAIKAILDKQSTDFQKSFKVSSVFYVRIMELVALFAAFTALLSFSSVRVSGLAAAIYLVIFLTAETILELASMFVILHDMKLMQSLQAAMDLTFKRWPNLMVLAFILMLGLSISFMPMGLIYMFGFWVEVLALPLQAVALVFVQAVWVLAFQELVKPVKLEKEEPLVLPEAA